jgi:hypothetical protein
MDGRLLDFHFSQAFYKYILNIPLTLNDLAPISPHLHQSLRSILDLVEKVSQMNLNLEENDPIRDMYLVYTFPGKNGWELMPNGAQIPVTFYNAEKVWRKSSMI